MRLSMFSVLVLAGCCMLIAFVLENITVASSEAGAYRNVLLTALGLMIVADVCCIFLFRRGGFYRIAAIPVALPSLFIIWDFIRRAPGAFGFR